MANNNCNQRERPMEWTNQHDTVLVREILVIEPYRFKAGSRESGSAWEKIADDLRKVHSPKFLVTQRSVRDRFRLLQNRFKISQQQELAASGINPEPTELDLALEEISEKMAVHAENHETAVADKREKAEKDRKSADQMRKMAMESLAQTQKRKAEKEDCGKDKKTRRSGNETVQFLREKAEIDRESKKEELRLREKEIEARTEAHNSMMRQQQQQQQNQQQQMQQTLALFAEQQKQVLELLGKFTPKK